MFKADHTCLTVNDPDAERRFYEKALELRLIGERRTEKGSRILFLAEKNGNYKLQLISGRGEPRPEYGHTAMVAEDFESALERHSAMGCVAGELIYQGSRRSYFIRDPEGYLTEILSGGE